MEDENPYLSKEDTLGQTEITHAHTSTVAPARKMAPTQSDSVGLVGGAAKNKKAPSKAASKQITMRKTSRKGSSTTAKKSASKHSTTKHTAEHTHTKDHAKDHTKDHAKDQKAKSKHSAIIYFDNNATTLPCEKACAAFSDWQKSYNASSSSAIASGAKDILAKSKKYLEDLCNAHDYKIIFTSGATESNCYILRSCAESYIKAMKVRPWIIISSIEHHSIIECCKNMAELGLAKIKQIKPYYDGTITAEQVLQNIEPHTCLVSIMYANNELGTINDIPSIARAVHSRGIPFHTDAVQIFGKKQINLPSEEIDALSMSFHKVYGQKGLGLLFIANNLWDQYKMMPLIAGSQQDGLRGGTENIPAIASSMAALKWNFTGREKKNQALLDMRNRMLTLLKKHINIGQYEDYIQTPAQPSLALAEQHLRQSQMQLQSQLQSQSSLSQQSLSQQSLSQQSLSQQSQFTLPAPSKLSQLSGAPAQQGLFSPYGKASSDDKSNSGMSGVAGGGSTSAKERDPAFGHDVELVILGSQTRYLPNTVLMSFVVNKGKAFCNVKFKKKLDEHGVVVSIGSACLVSSPKASHVLYSIGAPQNVKEGVFRISFSDYNKMSEVDEFVRIFVKLLREDGYL